MYKYFLFSLCNGELEYYEFVTKKEVKEFLNEHRYKEDYQVIYGKEVIVHNV